MREDVCVGNVHWGICRLALGKENCKGTLCLACRVLVPYYTGAWSSLVLNTIDYYYR